MLVGMLLVVIADDCKFVSLFLNCFLFGCGLLFVLLFVLLLVVYYFG